MHAVNRRVAVAAMTLWVLGLAVLGFGLTQLDTNVEGAYFNRAVDAQQDVVYATSVEGKAWIVASSVLLAFAGVASAMAVLRRP